VKADVNNCVLFWTHQIERLKINELTASPFRKRLILGTFLGMPIKQEIIFVFSQVESIG